jgi:hypothetical protein
MDVTVVPASAGEEGVPPDEPLLVSPPITPLLAQKPTTYLGFNRDTLEIRSRCESPSHLARRDSRAAAPRVPRVASGAASSGRVPVSVQATGTRHLGCRGSTARVPTRHPGCRARLPGRHPGCWARLPGRHPGCGGPQPGRHLGCRRTKPHFRKTPHTVRWTPLPNPVRDRRRDRIRASSSAPLDICRARKCPDPPLGAQTAPDRGCGVSQRARRRPEEAQSGAYAPPHGRPTRPPPISRGPSPPLPANHTLTRVVGPTEPRRWPTLHTAETAALTTHVVTVRPLILQYTPLPPASML